jgi:hypothetical protein
MSYFTNAPDADDFDDDFSGESAPRTSRAKLNIGIFLLICGLAGTTLAANISLAPGGRKEFGQGIYQIKACDQWVGIGLTSGSGAQNNYVANLKLYGFDPRLCIGRIFRIKLFPTGSTTPLDLYLGAGATAGSTETSTVLTLMDTSTAYASSGYSTYNSWAADAVTLVDKYGRNIGWADSYELIRYTSSTAVYTIVFTYPAALVSSVASVTIESAKYS